MRPVQMESSMQQLSEHGARPRMAKVLATAAALLCATALGQPNPAYAGPHGGGGGGGGGFHGGGFGGFHGGGFHAGFGGFHGGGFHGEFHGDRFHDRRFSFGGSFADPGWGYYPYYDYY